MAYAQNTTSGQPRPETQFDDVLGMAKELYQRLDTIGDQLGGLADRMIGSEPAVPMNPSAPQAVPNGKLDELQSRLRRALSQTEAIERIAGRLDSAL